MPDFIEPQLCRLVDRPPEDQGWVHEVKFDGYRLQLRVQAGTATLRTRKGLDWSARFPEICAAGRTLPDVLLDGEIVGLDDQGTPSFDTLQGALSAQRTGQLLFFAFDLLYADGEDLRPLSLADRKQRLHELLGAQIGPLRYVSHFEAAGRTVLESACRMSLEGIVSKRLDAPYSAGRGGGWLKSKCRAGQEVVIGGWSSEKGALRSLLVGVQRNGHLRYAGRVGTGFTRDAARRLQARFARLASQHSPFAEGVVARRAGGVRWLRPELVAEIEYAGWTAAGLLRQAAFKGLREDKPAAEVGVETAQPAGDVAAPSSAVRSAASPVSPVSGAVVLGVKVSQPDKPLWPDAGDSRPISKLELARYFEAAGPWLIEHVRARPCSLLRAPDGIAGQQFLQRHGMPGMSSLIELVHVSGDRKPYVVINRVEGLIAAAQIATLELHPWNCIPGRFEIPGRLVFDLDPAPDVPFEQVIQTALQLRERLTALGLVTFCKSTGGKGLHVVTPLAAERTALDWATAKKFAQAVCAQMAADSPQCYLTTMAKKARVGRIFLDYLRNDRMSTAVAPLSPRARAGAPVSMPLTWQQVRRGLDPQRYTVRSAVELLARSSPWQDYAEAACSLRAALGRLTGGGAAGMRRSRMTVAARTRTALRTRGSTQSVA
jgi:bifunctional non-homologous end joining protein LigD